jgi:hypothetical protein
MAGRRVLALVVIVAVFAAATLFLMMQETELSGPVSLPMRDPNNTSNSNNTSYPSDLSKPNPFPRSPNPRNSSFPASLLSSIPSSPTFSTPNSTYNASIPVFDLGNEAEEEDIQELLETGMGQDDGYEAFLAKLAIGEPNMAGSVVPWSLINIEPLNWTDEAWPLRMNISLTSDATTACKPTKFGLSEAQAAATFIPKAPFTSCCSKPHNFLQYANE